MQKLIVRNFGPISECEIQIENFLVLIGPQSSGKSTISKLVFFFLSIRESAIEFILDELDIDLANDLLLKEQFDLFFEKATSNIENNNGQYEDTVVALKSFFKKSTGIVVNSCHGVKGEEYKAVIAFGLLKGFIPHWSDIINQSAQIGHNAESKMLYVIGSRAKENLYLFAEYGRRTQGGYPYETSSQLNAYNYQYD